MSKIISLNAHAIKAGFIPVVIEIVARPPGKSLFQSKTEFDCLFCEKSLTATEVTGFVFCRRGPTFDGDTWQLEICGECFKQPGLVDRVQVAVQAALQDHPDDYKVIEVRLRAAKR